MAEPMSPLLDPRATLKDALSLMLDSDVQAGIVVHRDGSIAGLITVDEIAERMRQTAHQAAVAATPVAGADADLAEVAEP
jgi:CBS domain-containing protein